MTSWCKTPNKPSSGNNADKPCDSTSQKCPVKEENWIDLEYLYADGTGVAGARYRVIDDDSDKVVAEGILDNKGFAHCSLPIYVKNVSYNFFSDPPTVAYRKQPDLNPEKAKVKPGWYERMADSISETGSWVWGTIQGDFNENQTVGQIAANAAITMIPIVDQAGDIRDLIANLKFLIWDKRYDDKWVWVAIVLTLIGLVPFVGSAAKGVLKTVAHGIRTGAKIPLDLLIDVINKFHKGNAIKWLGELASDLPKKHAKTIKETFKTFLANFQAKLEQLAKRLPGFLGKQVKESIQSIKEIAEVADKNIDTAVKELQQGLNKALESGVSFERKGKTKTKNTRVQKETEPPEFYSPAIVREKIEALAKQGHGPQRHEGQLTERQLDERARLKHDPETGSRQDMYAKNSDKTPMNHKCKDHATKVNSEESYVRAEEHLRNSKEFRNKVAEGKPDIKIETSLEEIYGVDYKSHVSGRSRTAPWPDITSPTVPTDFSNGKMKAIYIRDVNGDYKLTTMYPEPN